MKKNIFYNAIIRLHEQDIKTKQVRDAIEFLYKRRSEDSVPLWYQLQIKAFCKLFDLNDMDGIDIATNVDGMPIYYASSYSELKQMTGNGAVYANKFWIDDKPFIFSASSDYYKRNGTNIGVAVVFEDLVAFVPENEWKKQQNREKLGIDTRNE